MSFHQLCPLKINRPCSHPRTSPLTLAFGAGAKAEAEATKARVAAAVNFMVKGCLSKWAFLSTDNLYCSCTHKRRTQSWCEGSRSCSESMDLFTGSIVKNVEVVVHPVSFYMWVDWVEDWSCTLLHHIAVHRHSEDNRKAPVVLSFLEGKQSSYFGTVESIGERERKHRAKSRRYETARVVLYYYW